LPAAQGWYQQYSINSRGSAPTDQQQYQVDSSSMQLPAAAHSYQKQHRAGASSPGTLLALA